MPFHYWKFLKVVKDHNVWYSQDGVFQVTKTKEPPSGTAGYHDLESLLKLKGLT